MENYLDHRTGSTKVTNKGKSYQRRARKELFTHGEPMRMPEHKPEPRIWDNATITATWIGHATVLINFFGFWILTDPVFSKRIGLNILNLFTLGPRRLVSPALQIKELPPVDLILLSHAHMDHMDTRSLRKFRKSVLVVTAKNTGDIPRRLGFRVVHELDWNETLQLDGLEIEGLEVRHFGWRFPWEKDRSRGFSAGRSYNAYLLTRNGRSIVFGGDTTYQEQFRQLKHRLPEIDLAIMPIGAYDPWVNVHANPEQALAMADHMGAYHILPVHWNTFILSQEPITEPIERLKRATATQPDRVVVDDVGQTWILGLQQHQARASAG